MQKPNKSLEKLNLILKYRQDLFTQLLAKKINSEDFANSFFQFLLQKKIKPVAKAHDLHSLLLNYYYWLSQIERKVAIERRLIEWNAGSVEKLFDLIEVYSKRRDQMVRRLIWELDLPIKKFYLVFGDTAELQLEDGQLLYSSKESLEKVKINVDKMENSLLPYYLPLIDIRQTPVF